MVNRTTLFFKAKRDNETVKVNVNDLTFTQIKGRWWLVKCPFRIETAGAGARWLATVSLSLSALSLPLALRDDKLRLPRSDARRFRRKDLQKRTVTFGSPRLYRRCCKLHLLLQFRRKYNWPTLMVLHQMKTTSTTLKCAEFLQWIRQLKIFCTSITARFNLCYTNC